MTPSPTAASWAPGRSVPISSSVTWSPWRTFAWRRTRRTPSREADTTAARHLSQLRQLTSRPPSQPRSPPTPTTANQPKSQKLRSQSTKLQNPAPPYRTWHCRIISLHQVILQINCTFQIFLVHSKIKKDRERDSQAYSELCCRCVRGRPVSQLKIAVFLHAFFWFSCTFLKLVCFERGKQWRRVGTLELSLSAGRQVVLSFVFRLDFLVLCGVISRFFQAFFQLIWKTIWSNVSTDIRLEEP